MPLKAAEFKRSSDTAVHDPQVQRALVQAMDLFTSARATAIEADYGEETWEQLRARAAAVKTHVIERLDYYLDLVDRNVRKAGGHVHFADDAAHANRIILDIAKRHGVKSVIKGKSMVSEELEINHVFEANGIESVETDLGEYIIQLARETPFHIVIPAIHKTRRQVSDLFQRWLKTAPTEDAERLCGMARDVLREKFRTADMGISGANFVVAETGTVVLVTNEGNGRMTTSAPRVHVAVTGMEKLLPAMEDVALFLRLLPRSATGQRITSYNTFVSGPRGTADEDGPEEFHLVLVDNGRLNLLRDEVLREALRCIKCGACLNHCPVYRKIGGHAYGWVYSGPIGAIVTPALKGTKAAPDLPYASTLCGACRDVCPVKIDIPRLLLHLRARVAEGDPKTERASTLSERTFIQQWYNTVKTRKAMDGKSRLARFLQKPLARGGALGSLPLPMVSAWTKDRDFPAVAAKTFRERWRDELSDG